MYCWYGSVHCYPGLMRELLNVDAASDYPSSSQVMATSIPPQKSNTERFEALSKSAHRWANPSINSHRYWDKNWHTVYWNGEPSVLFAHFSSEINLALSEDEQKHVLGAITHYKKGIELLKSALAIEVPTDDVTTKDKKEKIVCTLEYAEDRLNELNRSGNSRTPILIFIPLQLDWSQNQWTACLRPQFMPTSYQLSRLVHWSLS